MFFAQRVPYIAQLEAVECGAACLAMILAHYGHHAPLPEVRERCGVSRDGVNALAMLRAAESYGIEAQLYRSELEGLADIPLPAILHWEFSHFVVLERLDRNGAAYIIDPAQGRLRVTREMLSKSFTGAVLVFAPTPSLEPRPRKLPNLSRYSDLLHIHAGSFGQLLAFSLLLQIVGLAFPVGLQFLVDRVLLPHQPNLLWGIGIALALSVLVQALLQFTRGWVLASLQTVLDFRLLSDFMLHTVRLPLGFFLQRNPGDLLQRLESNRDLRHFLGTQITTSVLDTFLILGYGTLMMVYQWQIGLLVVTIGCLRALVQLAMRGPNRQAAAVELAALSRTGGTLVESLSALETIRAASAEALSIRRWADQVVNRANAILPRMRLESTSSELSTLLSTGGIAAVSAIAGYKVISGQMSIGVFSSFLTLQGLFLTPLNSLIRNLEHWQFLNSHFSRLSDVMEAEPEPSGALDAANLRGDIQLESVSFRYSPGAPWILSGIDIRIHPGEKVAIVGPSGAGKSTLARLLLGMLLPTEGTIYFDGENLLNYDLAKLRGRMGSMLQEYNLLGDSIFANLSLNDSSLPMAKVIRAAQLACIDTVIEGLPEGYATRLGEDGLQLSGGERQRLCLARALAHEPAVLVLDEATSSLDAEIEQQVHASLRSLQCTRIVIAHRFATVRDADRILVMDGGKIVQQGTFAELSSQPGLFRHLLDSQQVAND